VCLNLLLKTFPFFICESNRNTLSFDRFCANFVAFRLQIPPFVGPIWVVLHLQSLPVLRLVVDQILHDKIGTFLLLFAAFAAIRFNGIGHVLCVFKPCHDYHFTFFLLTLQLEAVRGAPSFVQQAVDVALQQSLVLDDAFQVHAVVFSRVLLGGVFAPDGRRQRKNKKRQQNSKHLSLKKYLTAGERLGSDLPQMWRLRSNFSEHSIRTYKGFNGVNFLISSRNFPHDMFTKLSSNVNR
jgi:hypothetical protein